MSGNPTNSREPSDHAHSARRPTLGRLLGESLGELNLLRVLPELAATLRDIRRFTEVMATEVRGMHAGVRRLETEVAVLTERVEELTETVVEVQEGMQRLEPHIADVNLAIRPLRRARARLPHRATAIEESPAVEESSAG